MLDTSIEGARRRRLLDAVLDDASFHIRSRLLMRHGSILYGGEPQTLDALERQCMNHENAKRYERSVEYKAMELKVQTKCQTPANVFKQMRPIRRLYMVRGTSTPRTT